MLGLTALGVIVAVAAMLLIAGNELDKQLDQRVQEVEKSFETNLNRVREDVRRELAAQPSPTAVPPPVETSTPFPTPTVEGEITPDPTEEPTPAPTPNGAGATPTPTPTHFEIRP
jgi:hypothetical protein